MAVKIIFEPHSTTTDNDAHLASGWNDVDLSPLGVEQLTTQWPDRYKDRKLDAIFTSDMQRAYKCAAFVATDKNIPVYIDSRLRECDYGYLTQKPKEEVNQQKVERISKPFPNGESYQDCMKRMKDFLDYLKESFDGKVVMIVGHRATQYGLEHWLNGKSIEQCVTEEWTYQPGWDYELV